MNEIKLIFAGDSAKLNREFDKVGSASKQLGDRVEASGQRTSRSFKMMGLAASAFGLIAVGALAKVAKSSIDAASDLAETQSKVKVIFGESSDAIEKFAAGAATALGQSKQQAMDAAATFAIFGKGAGLTGQKLVGFSTDMTKLASDLASFNNTSPEEAIVAIGAALRGESEPIRRYGVLLDDASLRNEAFALGLTKTTKNVLTPQQRVLAAQALIMKQTTAAQGDFARTSDGLANKQRIMKAEMANASAEMGQKLLPVMTKIVTVGTKMIDWMSKNRAVVLPLIGVIAAVTAAQWLWNIAMAANPIGLIVIAVAAVIAGLVLFATKTEIGRKIVGMLWAEIKIGWSILKAIGAWFAGPFANFFVKGWRFITWQFSTGLDVIKAIPGKIGQAFKAVYGFVTAPFRSAFNFVSDAWNGTVGKLHWTVPGWVPKIGGNSFSAPRLPHFHSGGVVPGTPGSEVLAVLQAGERVTPAGGGGGGMTLAVGSDGTRIGDALVWVLKRAIKEQGGNVQAVLGS
jgi:hypothetical protein